MVHQYKVIESTSGREALEKLRRDVENQKIPAGSEAVSVTVSIGASTETESLEAMIKKADEMLYHAKRKGRNRVVIDQEKY